VLAHFALNISVSQELYNIIAAQWNEHEAMAVPRLARVLTQISPEFIYENTDNWQRQRIPSLLSAVRLHTHYC